MKKISLWFCVFFTIFSLNALAIQKEACESLDNRSSSSNLKCLYFDSVNFNSNTGDITQLLQEVLPEYNLIIFPAKTFTISNTITIPRNGSSTKVSFRGTYENGISTKLIAGIELHDKFMFETPSVEKSTIGDKGLIIENIIFENNQCVSDNNKHNCGILKYIGNGARINNNSFISEHGTCVKQDSQSDSWAPGYNNRFMDNVFDCELPFYAPVVDNCTVGKDDDAPFCSLPTDQFFINNKMMCGDNCIKASGLSGTQFIDNEFTSDKFAISNTGRDSWISMHKNKYSTGGLFQLKYYTDKIEEKFTYPINTNLYDPPEEYSYIIKGNYFSAGQSANENQNLDEYNNVYNFYDQSTLCNQLSVCEQDLSKRFKSIISYLNNTQESITLYIPDNSNGSTEHGIDNTESEALKSTLTIVGSGPYLSSILFKAPLKVNAGGELIIENLTIRGNGDSVLDIKNSSLTLLHARIGKYEGNCISFKNSTNLSIKRSTFYNCNIGIKGDFDEREPNIEITESIVASLTKHKGPKEIKSFLDVTSKKSTSSGKIRIINNHMWGAPTNFFFNIKNVNNIMFEGNDFETLGSKGLNFNADSGSENKVKLLNLSGNSTANFNSNIFRVSKSSDEPYSKEYLIESGDSKIQFESNVFNIQAPHDSIDDLFDALDKIRIIPFKLNNHDKIKVVNDNNKINWKAENNTKGVFDISTADLKADDVSLTFDAQEVKFSWGKTNNATTYITELRAQNGKTSRVTSNWDLQTVYDATALGANPKITSRQRVGVSYQYRVKVCSQELTCSDWTESDVIYLLPKPASVNATVSNDKDITISWDEVSHATHYERESSSKQYDWRWLFNKSYTGLSVTDFNQKHRSSKYRVRSCNESGCSGWTISNKIGIKPLPPKSVNSWLTTNSSEPNKYDMNVHWSWVKGAEYYEREVHSSYKGWAWNKDYLGTSVTFPKYKSGVFRFRVRACNEGGCSDWREQAYSIKVP